jgi:hypothetical protein
MQALILALAILMNCSRLAHAQFQAQASNPAQGCISDICGPPAQSNLFMTKYNDRLGEYLNSFSDPKRTDFSPAIAKLFESIQAEELKDNSEVLDAFKRSTPLGDIKPDGFSKALYNIIYASPYLKKIKYVPFELNGKAELGIDDASSLAELGSLPAEDRNWILKIAKYFLASGSKSGLSDNQIETEPPAILLKQLHPDKSLPEAMKAELSKAQAEVASLKNLMPIEKAIYFANISPERIKVIEAHINDGTVGENESRELISWNIQVKRTRSYFGNSQSPLLNRDTPTVEEIIKSNGGIDTVVKKFEKNSIDKQAKNLEKVQNCKIYYFVNKGLLPSKAQLDRLNKDIKRSKQKVADLIKDKFPAAMQPKLLKAVESSDFVLPPSVDEFEKNLTGTLQQKLSSLQESSVASLGIAPDEMRKFLAVYAFSNSSGDSDGWKDDSNSYCGAFKYSPMSDANYTTYGSISLSFTTATGDESSRMKTLAHELGHTVSRAIADDPIASDQLSEVRKCLADQLTEELPAKTKKKYEESRLANPKANGPYVEEDFADSVAAATSKDLQGRNGWCQLLTLTSDKKQYLESSVQADDSDNHSSSLFRLLKFETAKKGGLPDSCVGFLKAIGFKENFASCLDLANPKGGTMPASPSKTQK